jgi:hypothetical protein
MKERKGSEEPKRRRVIIDPLPLLLHIYIFYFSVPMRPSAAH